MIRWDQIQNQKLKTQVRRAKKTLDLEGKHKSNGKNSQYA